MIGHSEEYVRKWCIPYGMRDDPETMIRLRIPMCDVMDTVYKREVIKK